MAQLFTPDLDHYVQMATQARLQPRGADYAESLGDIEAANLTPTLTDIERFSREYAEKTLAATKTIQKDASFTMTCLSLNRTTASMLFMDSDGDKLTQAAVATETKTFTNLKVGRSYNLGKRNVSIISIDDGSEEPVNFVLDAHYKLVAETGDIEIIAIPSGATQVEVTFSAAAIDEEDDIAVYGLMAGQGVFGKITFYGINDEGVRYQIEFWNVRITVTGSIPLQGGDDYLQVELNVRVYADGTKPSKYRFAKITELKG
ncbi:hypothetical protein FHL81_10895 [Agrobacterium tumefaciens]|uniref:phage tail tube protein n=1 Tax=Agrobacterium tumefaciens TaxID=358 RepID=UPI0011F0A9B9|nr:hypothetical protein [Agrobacterium tumefaciens]KAA1237138.1 hypothetical protein FHL81_10895 [Agrobacterium tumefaciens]